MKSKDHVLYCILYIYILLKDIDVFDWLNCATIMLMMFGLWQRAGLFGAVAISCWYQINLIPCIIVDLVLCSFIIM